MVFCVVCISIILDATYFIHLYSKKHDDVSKNYVIEQRVYDFYSDIKFFDKRDAIRKYIPPHHPHAIEDKIRTLFLTMNNSETLNESYSDRYYISQYYIQSEGWWWDYSKFRGGWRGE